MAMTTKFPQVKSPKARNQSKIREMQLKSILDNKAKAQTNPRLLQKRLSGRGRTDSNDRSSSSASTPKKKYNLLSTNKNIHYDEFTQMFRCQPVNEDLIETVNNLSLDLQEHIQVNEEMPPQHLKLLSEEYEHFTRAEFYSILLSMFPKIKLSEQNLSQIAKELFPRKPDKIVPKKFFTSVLSMTAHLARTSPPPSDQNTAKLDQHKTKAAGRLFKKFAKLAVQEELVTEEAKKRTRRAAYNNQNELVHSTRVQFQVDGEEISRNSAMEKLSKAVASSNFNGHSNNSLQGFKGSDMSAQEFNDQIKRAFNFSFSPDELKSVIEIFDLDGDGKVSCAEFLSLFFRMKRAHEKDVLYQERDKRQTKEREIAREHLLETQREEKVIENAIEPWKESDLKSAVGAIAEVAANWTHESGGPAGLSGFMGNGLDPIQFREQLWRTFDVVFTKAELSALLEAFDNDGDGTIDGPEFLSMFYRLQKKEKAHRIAQRRAKEIRVKVMETERLLRNRIEIEEKQHMLVDNEFSDEDLGSGINKLREAQKSLSTRKGAGPSSLEAFTKGPAMTPVVFRNLCASHFLIYLTPKEVGAVCSFFDADGDGTIDGAEFISAIMKMWTDAAKLKKINQLEADRKTRQRWVNKQQQRDNILNKAMNEYQLCEYSQHDTLSALAKIKLAAANYDSRINTSLNAFQNAPMNPHEFKEMLCRTFKMKFSRCEISSLMHFFDHDGQGVIEGSDFLSTFFLLRREEQSAHIALQKQVNKDREVRRLERMKNKKKIL